MTVFRHGHLRSAPVAGLRTEWEPPTLRGFLREVHAPCQGASSMAYCLSSEAQTCLRCHKVRVVASSWQAPWRSRSSRETQRCSDASAKPGEIGGCETLDGSREYPEFSDGHPPAFGRVPFPRLLLRRLQSLVFPELPGLSRVCHEATRGASWPCAAICGDLADECLLGNFGRNGDGIGCAASPSSSLFVTVEVHLGVPRLLASPTLVQVEEVPPVAGSSLSCLGRWAVLACAGVYPVRCVALSRVLLKICSESSLVSKKTI